MDRDQTIITEEVWKKTDNCGGGETVRLRLLNDNLISLQHLRHNKTVNEVTNRLQNCEEELARLTLSRRTGRIESTYADPAMLWADLCALPRFSFLKKAESEAEALDDARVFEIITGTIS